MDEARERSKAGGKKAGAGGIKFEAEATGHLQKQGVPLTVRSPACMQVLGSWEFQGLLGF